MAIHGVNPKCYILALFVRDDGARFLLGDDPFEFKDNQLHFQQNTMANDVVEVQGNDGYLLAGQVRRPGTQVFDGYVCNGTNSKEEVEVKRREFLQFFRRSHFYKVIYVFPNGTAIQRKQGFLVDDPTVQELYQQYPEYHVALNFEDVNYYTYEEDEQGHEIYAKEAIVPLARGGATGGLIWDSYGVVWEDAWSLPLSISGVQFQILNNAGARAPIDNVELYGDTYQQTYSGKNLFDGTYVNYAIGGGSGHGWFANANSRSAVIKCSPNTVYSIKKYETSNRFVICDYPTNPTATTEINLLSSGSTVSEATVTTHSDAEYLFVFVSNASGEPQMQVEQNSSPTSYEPYTGGIPAPNPDYPQDIQVVTGEQTVTVTGKNLFNKNNPNTMAGYFSSSDTIIKTGSATHNVLFWIPCSPSTQYSLLIPSDYGIITKVATSESVPENNLTITGSQRYTNAKVDGYTTSATAKYLVVYLQAPNYTISDIFSDIIAKVQIEQGSTATSYEPYQGQSYPISLTGKNLFNVSATPTYTNGVSVSGSITVTATSSGTSKYALYRLVEAKNYVGSKVCVSCSTMHPSSTNDARIEIGLCNADGTSKTSKAYTNNVNLKPSFTVTDDPSKPYIYVALYASYSSSASVGDYVGYGNVMVNRGSTPGTYASYSPIELCKIGTYQDYIYKSGDDWYIHKELGKHTFDGNETIAYNSSNHGFTINPTNLSNYLPNLADPPMVGLSTHFKVNSNTSTWVSDNTIGLSSAGTFWCKATSFATSQQDCTTWLTNNTPTVYYGFATATDTKITDATLVGQLEALDATRLFIGENNVLVSTPEPNLPATLSFDYYTKFAAIGAEWEEGGTKGATIVNVDAIDNTYPVWELTGPATNPTLSVLTTNTALTYNGTITASQKLVIDMFNKTATLNGTSVIGNISGDFVYMAPGTNRVAYTAGNTDAPDSTIYWQEVVG